MNQGTVNSHEDHFVTCAKTGRPLSDCLVIDAHAHLGVAPGFPYVDSSLESLIGAMDRLGIDRVYLSSTMAVFGLDRAGNDQILEAVYRYPERIRGYMALNPGYADKILPEMERCYAAGLRAVKIWSYGAREGLRYDHPNYEHIFRFADERELPILAHTWGGELDQLDAAFRKYTRINWLLAHTGSQDLPKYIRVAKEFERVYLETCFSRCPRGLIERLVAEVPLHKIIWGTDQTFMNAAHQLGRVLTAQITPEQKRAILGANAACVLEK